MPARNPQMAMLKKQNLAYGGELLRTREGRSHGRPLDTKNTMHLVLRSTKAVGAQSFWRKAHKGRIRHIITRFSNKYGIKILSMANVGNHLHLHIKLSNRFTYAPFIRAITSAIAMAVTGVSRWNKANASEQRQTQKQKQKSISKKDNQPKIEKFWDYRPFTRVVVSYRAFLNLKDYIRINELEGFGLRREHAEFFMKWNDLKEERRRRYGDTG